MPKLDDKPETDPDNLITIGVKPQTYGVKVLGRGEATASQPCISAGIDWLSTTTPDAKIGTEWYRAFCKYRQRYPLLIQDWYHQGGYRGQKCVSVYYGESAKYGYIFKATGSAAGELLTWLCFSKERDFRVTRLDIRLDIRLVKCDERVASKIFYDNIESKRPRFKLVRATEGAGETVYIGSPQSSSSVRVYDKGAEKGQEAGWLWRYEVVYRKPVADEIYDQVRIASIEDRFQAFIMDNIGSWLESRGVAPNWPHEVLAIPVIISEMTPWDQKLMWLKRSVAKTVAQLIEAGYEREVREIFDL
jgi:hypothetical protein